MWTLCYVMVRRCNSTHYVHRQHRIVKLLDHMRRCFFLLGLESTKSHDKIAHNREGLDIKNPVLFRRLGRSFLFIVSFWVKILLFQFSLVDLGSFAKNFCNSFLALNQPFDPVILNSGIYCHAVFFIDQFAVQIIWFAI